jgi:ribose-phosphate pyrophosphokinase
MTKHTSRSTIHVKLVGNPLMPIALDHVPLKLLTFPGGEPHCHVGEWHQLDGGARLVPSVDSLGGCNVLVLANVVDPEGFMHLLAVLDAVRSQSPRWLGLAIPYFPGARQDHPERGTPFTARVYADAIARVGAPDRVLVLDPHSHVLRALVGDRMDWLNAEDVLPVDMQTVHQYQGVIAPDAGAAARARAVAGVLGVEMVQASKSRDPHTGHLSLTEVPDLLPGRWLVVDDICDGGGTFVRIADQVRRAQNADRPTDQHAELDLFVSHGIFSKGVAALAPWFKNVFTTDSLPLREAHPQLHVVSLRSAIEKWVFSCVHA